MRTNKKKVNRLENRSLKNKNEHFDCLKRQKNKIEEDDLDFRNIKNLCETRKYRLNASSNLEKEAHKHTSPVNSFFPNLIFVKKDGSHKTINRELSTINSNEIKSSFYKKKSKKYQFSKEITNIKNRLLRECCPRLPDLKNCLTQTKELKNRYTSFQEIFVRIKESVLCP